MERVVTKTDYGIKPKLYIHVAQATHFLRWERTVFAQYFVLVDKPGADVILMVFGPDALEEGADIVALKRYATLFPGFGHNPVYNKKQRILHRRLIKNKYDGVFINNGPLEIAYKGLNNVHLYSFSIDIKNVIFKKPRKKIKSILHVSSDYPQKDWKRSEEIMKKTGLKWEVFPPRDVRYFQRRNTAKSLLNKIRHYFHLPPLTIMPHGYIDHNKVIKKYQHYDSFIHVARDIKDETYIDGKYTASLIEAGLTGAIIFWHDTMNLGNNLQTVFEVPLDPTMAAQKVKEIMSSIDVESHSKRTHEEMMRVFNPEKSVWERASVMLMEYNRLYE